MKKKLPVLFTLVLLLAFCFTSAGGSNITRDQKIRDDVTTYSVPSSGVQETGSSENVSSANQTITLKNPTFQELKDFVLADPTHRHAFVLNEYECRNFATDMVNDAVKQGIECGFVLLCFDQGQHAVVAFNTTDRGLIYVEPQTNAAVEPKIGGTYMSQKINDILIAW
jgi:hypothetical protein